MKKIAILIIILVSLIYLLKFMDAYDTHNISNVIERKPNNMVILEDKDSKMIINIGSDIQYSHSIYGSVGTGYRIEYDSTAFRMSCETVYDKPTSVAFGMCGGDKAVQTCKLRPLKVGEYTIKIIHEFRGDVERVVTHTIKVI